MITFLNKSGIFFILISLLTSSILWSNLPEKDLQAAHNFDLPTPDGKTINLDDYKGKIILLNFWATWSTPCLKEMPALEKLHQQYSDEDLQIIGIAIVSKQEDIPKKILETGITYPVGIGGKQLIADYGYFTSIPQSFLIDRSGKIVKEYAGTIEFTKIQKELTLILHKPALQSHN